MALNCHLALLTLGLALDVGAEWEDVGGVGVAGDGARRLLDAPAHHEEAAAQHRHHAAHAHALPRRWQELEHL